MSHPAAVVFVHGLSKKPPAVQLEEIWLWALARGNPMPPVFAPPNPGIDLAAASVPSFMTYYADVFYGDDVDTDLQAYLEADGGLEADLGIDGLLAPEAPAGPDPVGAPPAAQEFLQRFQATLEDQFAQTAAQCTLHANVDVRLVASGELEMARLLPAWARQAIIKIAAMEAYYYLFDQEYVQRTGQRVMVRAVLRQRLLAQLHEARHAAQRVMLVAHSMGTMIAYDVLRNCPACPPVDTLFTLGSPLGLREVRAELAAPQGGRADFPADRLAHWINVYDPLDPICGAHPRCANDYLAVDGKAVVDMMESNWGRWRHTITHYLAGRRFRAALARAARIALD